MAAFHAMKRVANRGALVALAGVLSSGMVYAGKKAVAAETESCGLARLESSKQNASEDGRRGLACAPQFDGLDCFETIVMTGKHLKTVKASGTENWNLSCAPQFDGLDCFETIVSSGKHPRHVNQPSAMKKSEPNNRGVALAP